jgi:hypothetical protein
MSVSFPLPEALMGRRSRVAFFDLRLFFPC